jgi:sphingosine kinase
MSFVTEDDPFKDPSLHAASTPQRTPPANVPDTLAVGRNASLTLGTDSLVVLGTDPCFWRG